MDVTPSWHCAQMNNNSDNWPPLAGKYSTSSGYTHNVLSLRCYLSRASSVPRQFVSNQTGIKAAFDIFYRHKMWTTVLCSHLWLKKKKLRYCRKTKKKVFRKLNKKKNISLQRTLSKRRSCLCTGIKSCPSARMSFSSPRQWSPSDRNEMLKIHGTHSEVYIAGS